MLAHSQSTNSIPGSARRAGQNLANPSGLLHGALLMLVAVKQWVFTLSALAVIEEAQPGLTAGIALYLLFVAATQALMALPIIAFAVAPEKSARPLAAAQGWLQRHNRVIMIVVSFVFGVWFLYQGVSSLLAFGAP